jgi:large subunit ribosomal protein L13
MPHITHTTKPIKESQIDRKWYLIDASKQVVGRVSTQAAGLLIGKHKVMYAPYLDTGDYVVLINANNVSITGKKAQEKTYMRFSGYPGGLKKISYKEMSEKKPTEILRHSISGMLPKNKLRKRRITRLYIYPDENHPFQDKSFEVTNS